MLKQRVLTALVLLAFLLPALFAASAWPFALLTLIGFGAAGWEWARLNGAVGLAPLFGTLLVCACAAAYAAGWGLSAPPWAWWVTAVIWVVGGAFVLSKGTAGWPGLPQPLRLA
ncbi:MAG: phosphatidate cytidylyltransferase, partial [Caldimonas sp.]